LNFSTSCEDSSLALYENGFLMPAASKPAILITQI